MEACPFLSQPSMRRNEKGLPPEHGHSGIMIKRNPGIMLMWTTTEYKPFKVPNGVLFRIGDPVKLEFFSRGRPATHDEIMASIESGLPELRRAAEEDGAEGVAEMEKAYQKALTMVPA